MQLARTKRKQILRHSNKSGKHFPLTHSEGKSLDKYRRWLAVYGMGRNTGCSSSQKPADSLSTLKVGNQDPKLSVHPLKGVGRKGTYQGEPTCQQEGTAQVKVTSWSAHLSSSSGAFLWRSTSQKDQALECTELGVWETDV